MKAGVMLMRVLWVVPAILVLVACQVPGTLAPAVVPGGSRLILNQPLTVRANSVKVLLQDGEVIYSPNEYRTFCRLEISDLQGVARTVAADTFMVRDAALNVDNFAALELPGYLYADLVWDSTDGLPSPVLYQVKFALASAEQPDVLSLTCSRRQDPTIEARYPTLAEIQQALGAIITIVPAV